MNLEVIFRLILQFLGKFLSAKATPPGVSTLAQDIKAANPIPEARVESFLDKIKASYAKFKYVFDQQDFLLVQDPGGQYNDHLIYWIDGKPVRWLCTGEGGDKTEGYWRSRFLPGQYIDLYSLASGEFPPGLPYCKMNYAIDVLNLETLQVKTCVKKDCHIHLRRSKSERIGISSMGCLVLKVLDLGLEFFALIKRQKRKKFTLTVILIKDCPWVHEVPFYAKGMA